MSSWIFRPVYPSTHVDIDHLAIPLVTANYCRDHYEGVSGHEIANTSLAMCAVARSLCRKVELECCCEWNEEEEEAEASR